MYTIIHNLLRGIIIYSLFFSEFLFVFKNIIVPMVAVLLSLLSNKTVKGFSHIAVICSVI